MKRTILVLALALVLAGCTTLSNLANPTPEILADEETVLLDVDQIKADVTPAIASVPEFADFFADVKGKRWAEVAVDLVVLAPKVKTVGGPLLADFKKLAADVKELAHDLSTKNAAAKAEVQLAKP